MTLRDSKPAVTRREAIAAGLAGMATLIGACDTFKPVTDPPPPSSPRLTSRVTAPTNTAGAVPGVTIPYIITGVQTALLYIPTSYHPPTPIPLVLMFHGAGSTASSALNLFQPYADAAGLALLAVDSYSSTWDIVLGAYGPDVKFVDAALAATFAEVYVDPARVTVEGFSDGASYALAVGRTNGDLFSRVISFSAGFMPSYVANGKPAFFMSHGLNDTVLNINAAGRPLSQSLIAAGYDVDYVEFDGGHEVPPAIAQQAISWLAT